MRRGSEGTLMAVCVGTATLLAGCSSQSGPTSAPPSPRAPTVVPTTPGAASSTPATTGTSDQAAIAVAKAYFSAFNEGLKTRDSKPLRSLTTGACIPCNEDADFIDSLAKSDRTVAGGAVDFRLDQKYPTTRRFGGIFVGMVVQNRSATVMDAQGKVVDRFQASVRKTVYLDLYPRGSQWLVRGIS